MKCDLPLDVTITLPKYSSCQFDDSLSCAGSIQVVDFVVTSVYNYVQRTNHLQEVRTHISKLRVRVFKSLEKTLFPR